MWHGQFILITASGCLLGAKLVSASGRPSIFFQSCLGFSRAGAKNNIAPHFARTGWRLVTPRRGCGFFRAKTRRSDMRMFNGKRSLAKKVDPALKPSQLKEVTYLTHLYAQKWKCPRRVFRYPDPDICSTCPSRGLTSGYFYLFFSPPKMSGLWGGPNFPKLS